MQNNLAIDFQLVDFFTETPDKSFLSGVTAGWQVGTSKVDGVDCRHLFFSQRGGIDLQLWVQDNDSSILSVASRSARIDRRIHELG